MSELVPEGWSLKPLSALAEYHNGRAFKPEDWSKTGLPILRIAQINDPFRATDHYDGADVLDKHLIKRGDLVFSWSATLKAILWRDYDAVLNQHIFKVIERAHVSRKFLQQLLDHSIERLSESSHGSTMKHIKKGVLDEFHCPVPPLPEQKKIAAILTSVDEVIDATQKQIDKLQDLKKATMNELLTKGIGHTEFKDSELGRIPKSWMVYRISELLVQSKTTGKSSLPIYSVLIDGGMVNRNTQERRIPSELDETSNLYVKEGNLAYNMMRMWQGASGIAPEDCLVSPAYVICEPKETMRSKFLGYLLKSEISIQKLCAYSQGITSDRLRLYFEHFAQIRFAIPKVDEQEEIAEVVSVVEANLLKTQRKLIQTQSLKKSLMQDLLTGKVRVKVD